MIQLSLSQMFNWPAEIPMEGGGAITQSNLVASSSLTCPCNYTQPGCLLFGRGSSPSRALSWRELSKHPLDHRRPSPPLASPTARNFLALA